MNKHQTQCRKVLKYLQTGRGLTGLEALNRFGSIRLAARVFELRRDGHRIESTFQQIYGKRVARYWLSA